MSERVKIVGDHPHRGSRGTIRADQGVVVAGRAMERVQLDDGDYPGQECFAEQACLRPLPAEEDPDA